MPERVVVLGGARSGKSRFALTRARQLGGDAVTFVATARSGDPELDARIAAHRRDRPSAWPTIEADSDLAKAIAAARPGDVVLLDSLTLWVGSVLEAAAALGPAWERARAALDARQRPSVLVSDEVGLGVVPATESGRRFRDELGWLNQQVAGAADEVWLCVAGVPLAVRR